MNTLIPPTIQDILVAPPLLRGEDEAAYQRLVAQLGAESGAATLFDWVQVKDIADLTWQIARVRRWVTTFIASGEHGGLKDAVHDVYPSGTTTSQTIERVFGTRYDDPGMHAKACRNLLVQHGRSPDQVGPAHAFFGNLRSLADAEELLMRLELRRDRAIAQIEARRRAFGAGLRAAANRVVDVEAAAPRLVEGLALAPPIAAKAEPSVQCG
jgi:hypothetical protein